MNTDDLGLRERKKLLTRATIAEAALDLSLEKGLDNVTIEDIAERAFVSPRTISNYFSRKEEAVVASGGYDWEAVVEALAELPAEEPPLEALCQALVDYIDSRTVKQQRAAVRKLQLVDQHESLLPYHMAELAKLEQSLMTTIAARSGTDVETDMYPRLVATGAVSAIKSAIGLWASQGYPKGTLAGLIRDAFDEISAGLPAPHQPEDDAPAAGIG